MKRSLLAVIAPLVLFAATAAAAPGEVRVPRDVAREAAPPPFARTCVVSFDELAPVDAACPTPAYSETWDGPVLLATNHTGRSFWVSYRYRGQDGRLYHGPCYEIPADGTRAIPDQAITPLRHRQVHVTQSPGPGFPSSGFQISCREVRQVVVEP